MIAGKAWGWIAAEPFFLRGLRLDLSPAALVVLLQMFSVGLAGLIPLSSGADRWRLGAICASTALLAGWTYPLFAHWVWGGGWLAQLGVNCGLGRGFVDGGGSGTIQAVGGFTALVDHVDSWAAAREVLCGSAAGRDSRTQRGAGPFWEAGSRGSDGWR